MRRVTIVSSYHRENGAANAANLYRILEKILPEVIFLEVSPDDFKLLYGNPLTLEPKAVNEFARNHKVALVPIDLTITAVDTKTKADQLFDTLDSHSADYAQQIDHRMNKCVSEDGFQYLNSEQHSRDRKEMDEEDLKVVRELNHPQITQLHNWWVSLNARREDEMLERIYEYSRKNSFQTAAFLVGSAHQVSLRRKISELNDPLLEFTEWDSSE